jgi:hypothetical protein
MTKLTEWLDFGGGGFCAWNIALCLRNYVLFDFLNACAAVWRHLRFLLWQVLCMGPAAAAVVLCTRASEGK